MQIKINRQRKEITLRPLSLGEFLEGGEADVKQFKSCALRTILNITRNVAN